MMGQESHKTQDALDMERMLSRAGYAPRAIRYFMEKPYIGEIPDADQVSEMTGTCGDTMKVWLKVKEGVILDVRYQVMGCAGAISAAMALVDLVRGKRIAEARAIHDGDVFRLLEDIPAQKNHCIELAVKTFQKGLAEYVQKLG